MRIKKPFLSITVVTALCIIMISEIANTNSNIPPVSRTGAPLEGNCSGCHSGNLNTGSGDIIFSLDGLAYVPDSTYNATVQLVDGTKSRFGFQITALDSNNNGIGTFVATNTLNTFPMSNLGREYITQKNASSNNTWSFEWTAPDSNIGPITFYICGNATNNNFSTTGDNVYTRMFTLDPDCGISLLAVGTNAVCNSACDGTASATITSGTGPFSYNWSSTPAQTTATAVGLCAGTYEVTVTDGNGCTTSTSLTISELQAMVLATTGIDANCGVPDGSALASISNGIAPYTYLWSDGQTSSMATGLSAGIYDVTVIDNNSCSETASITVINTGAPVITATSFNTTCNAGSDGSASVTANGGLPPYTYNWNAPAVSSTDSVSGLSADTYTIVVEDSVGCIVMESVTITEPLAVAISLTYTQVSNDSTCDGSASANPSGGTGAMTYLWNDPSNQITADANGLCLGMVGVTVTDNNGCSTNATIYVDSIVFLSIGKIDVEMLEMKVFPSPSSGELKVRFSNSQDKELRVSVYDLSGKLIIDENLGFYDKDIYTIDLSQNENGFYFVQVIADNSEVITRKISLIR